MPDAISVSWADRLEDLADKFFDAIHPAPAGNAGPWRRTCVVVNSPTTAGWLKQHFLFNRRGKGPQRVLAGLDIEYLYAFINDWLARLDSGADARRREPRFHPYSMPCLRWRLFRMLKNHCPEQLESYLEGVSGDRRRFDLAGVLAKLFDDYQVYRPDLLTAWEKPGFNAGSLGENAWQPGLWQSLVENDNNSYLSLFNKINAKNLAKTGLKNRYAGIHVFGVSAMPPVYIHFFQQAAEAGIPISFYTFNPCAAEYWSQDVSEKEKHKIQCRLSGAELKEEQLYLETGNPLLSSLGKGLQFYLEELIDRTNPDQAVPGPGAGASPQDDTMLHVIQNDIRQRRTIAGPEGERAPAESGATRAKSILTRDEIGRDDSIQIHICHSPWREVEVLRDYLLKWFADDENRQPRDVQVLVSDMATYAPYIDAVFATQAQDAAKTIPYVVTDRGRFSTCRLADAFLGLVKMPGSRFEASAIVGLLDMEAIRESAGLSAESVARIRGWVRDAGICWGRDAAHATKILGNDAVGNAVGIASWRAGLDRLLAGYALGSGHTASELGEPIELENFGKVLPIDLTEGGPASDLGRLAGFFDRIESLAREFETPCNAVEWEKRLAKCLDDLFAVNNSTCRDVAVLRRVAADFARTLQAAGFQETDEISWDLVAAALEQTLADAPAGADLVRNSVPFSQLRVMRSTPRRLVCLLGMDDGVFPRSDRRAAFDLMAGARRRCDRSDRLDDRLAFLEALMCAREKLYISYRGRNDRSNEVQPPSTVVSEIKDYLLEAFDCPGPEKNEEGQKLFRFETLHRLQPFHHLYFSGKNKLFSYSYSNLEAAKLIRAAQDRMASPTLTPCPLPGGEGDRAASGEKISCFSWRFPDNKATKPEPGADQAESIPQQPQTGAGNAGQQGAAKATITYEQLSRFLKNPAKTFYTQTLMVRFDDDTEENLPDRECLDIEQLDRHKARQYLVESIRKAGQEKTPELLRDWHITLASRGLIPPGTPGELFVKDNVDEIEEWLDEEVAGLGITRRALLEKHDNAPRQPVSVELELGGELQTKATVVGAFRLIESAADQNPESDCMHVAWRYADWKAKDLLNGQIAHLLIAAGGKRVKTLVIAKKKTYATSRPTTEEAKEELAKIVRNYLAGMERIIPFAPESSYAFADAGKKAQQPDRESGNPPDPDTAASNKWDNKHGWSESNDPYLFRAFGEDGPMADKQEFKTLANAVCRPILDSAQEAKEGKSSGAKKGKSGSAGADENAPEGPQSEPRHGAVKKTGKAGKGTPHE